MKNTEFRIGSHILVYGNRGIVEGIEKCKEYEMSYAGKGCEKRCFGDAEAERLIGKGYTLVETGRTATYFTVCFDLEESLKGTAYNHGTYGCIDEFANYGTW